MVSKSDLRNCQDRSFAVFNMMVKESFRKFVKFIFCVIHNYACIGQRYDVFESAMIVADSYQKLQDKLRSQPHLAAYWTQSALRNKGDNSQRLTKVKVGI